MTIFLGCPVPAHAVLPKNRPAERPENQPKDREKVENRALERIGCRTKRQNETCCNHQET